MDIKSPFYIIQSSGLFEKCKFYKIIKVKKCKNMIKNIKKFKNIWEDINDIKYMVINVGKTQGGYLGKSPKKITYIPYEKLKVGTLVNTQKVNYMYRPKTQGGYLGKAQKITYVSLTKNK